MKHLQRLLAVALVATLLLAIAFWPPKDLDAPETISH